MGKKIVDEDMHLNININGDKGKKALFELEESVRDLNLENEKLERSLQKYEKQLAKNESTINKYSQTLEKEIANQAKQEQAYTKAHEEISRLYSTYRKLDAETKKSRFGQKLHEDILKYQEAANKSRISGEGSIKAQQNLRREIDTLSRSNTKLTQQHQEGTAKLKANNTAITEADAKIKTLRKNLDISTLSLDELNQEIARTTVLFRKADPNTDAWKEYQSTLVKLRTRQQELSNQAQATKGVLCRIADGINKYWNFVVSGLASLTGVVMGVKQAISKYVEFTDVLADVRKTTGLTERGVLDLNNALKEIDTRTSQEELMGLARIGGKLGIEGKENLEGFARAADKINVALKEDLGGDTEASIRQVGKLVEIFKLSGDFGIEQSLLKVGSIINELGASSTANEGYLVEFSKRVAGVAPSVGVSVDKVMGLAATLDQLGQTAEVSGTVYSNLVTGMFKNTAEYARVAGTSVTDFSNLIKEDANEALIRLFEGLKGNNGEMERMVINMGDIGMDNVRAVSVLGALANNTQLLREQQSIANKAFVEGISLTDEFNIKNTNLAARRDKAKKQLDERIKQVGEKLHPLMIGGLNTMGLIVKVLGVLITFLGKYGAVVLQIVAVYGAYLAATKLNILWTTKWRDALTQKSIAQRLDIILTNGQIAATHLLTAAKFLLIGNIKAATAAFKAFALAIKASPVGLFIAAIAAIGMGIYKLCTHTSNFEKAMKRVKDTSAEFEKEAALEERTLKRLFGTLQGAKEGTKEWYDARKAITDKYGQYLSDLNIEIKTLDDARKAYDTLSTSIKETARLKALEKSEQTAAETLVDVEVTSIQRIKNALDKVFKDSAGEAEKYFEIVKRHINTGEELDEDALKVRDRSGIYVFLADIRKARKTYQAEMDMIKATFGDTSKAISTPLVSRNPSGGDSQNSNPDLSDSPASSSFNYERQIVELKEKYAKQLIEKDAYETELDRLELEHLKYRLVIEAKTEEDKLKLRAEIAAKQASINEKQQKQDINKQKEYVETVLSSTESAVFKENKAFNDRLRQAGIYGKAREKLTEKELAALEIIEKEHQDNLKKINDDATKKRQDEYIKEVNLRIKNMETGHKMELNQLQQQQAEEMAAFTGSAFQHKQMILKHQKAEQALTKKHAQELVSLMNNLLATAEIDRIDLGEAVLSDEQKQDIEEKLSQLKKKIAEIFSEMNKPEWTDGTEKVDVLGMNSEQWEQFFTNLEQSRFGVEELMSTVTALKMVWSSYHNYKTAQEQKEFKRYEDTAKKERATLDAKLASGQISQERYNARISQMDAELDAKKEELQKKAAKREKAMSIIDSIINTAVGVTAALRVPYIGMVLAAIVAAMGAAQVAAISAQQYAKGKYPVIGNDDGRTYQADYAGDNLKTGIYQKPTLGLFSEKEPEMVVDGATTRKLVFDYPNIYRSIMDISKGRAPQYADGRYPGYEVTSTDDPRSASTSDPEMKQLLRENIRMMQVLIDKPVEIPWYGHGGIADKMKKAQQYEQQTTFKR